MGLIFCDCNSFPAIFGAVASNMRASVKWRIHHHMPEPQKGAASLPGAPRLDQRTVELPRTKTEDDQ
jgi:hypothetical protein